MESAVVGLGETPEKLESQNGKEDQQQKDDNNKKRENFLLWDDYFMSVALLSAQRSKDPSTQVGACIVNEEHKIVGIGYNGMPLGCDDDEMPWGKTASSKLDTKYPYVCHAEMNAIMNKNSSDLKGCTIYVALFPCNECAKLIIQARITTVIYLNDKPDKIEMIASRRLLDMAKIKHRKYTPCVSELRINLLNGKCELSTELKDFEKLKL